MAARKNAKAKAKADSAGDGVQAHGGEAAEVSDEVTQVVEFAAGIDVAKGFGMVCTRVPGSRAGRRRQKVWRVNATFSEVTALMDHLVCEGIQRLVLESTTDYWRIWYYLAEAGGLEVQLVNARDVKHLPGRAEDDPLTELRREVLQVSGRMGDLVATVADHDHRWRWAAGPVAAGGAAGRVS